MRIFLVEDDEALSQSIRRDLKRAGFAVDVCGDGKEAEIRGAIEPYDAVVLDLGLPGRSGLEVLRNWRSRQVLVPVIVLTARDSWPERIEGFKAGADDYLGKPFHPDELLARINAVLRRSHQQSVGAILEVGGVRLDEDRQEVSVADGEIVTLTGIEFRLLRYFMLNANKVLSKSRLTEHVYEQDADKDSNVLEVYIRRLREKMGKEVIATQRGQGYVFKGLSG